MEASEVWRDAVDAYDAVWDPSIGAKAMRPKQDAAATAVIERAKAEWMAEARIAALEEAAGVVEMWVNDRPAMLLACGEMSAQEIRTVRAVMKNRIAAIRAFKEKNDG